MSKAPDDARAVADDIRTLHKLGYAQELARCLGAFSNFAISLSIICILAGGITSFHQGFGGVGGAAIGVGWPLVCLFALAVAITMGQVASAFPTAGGLYHWASVLGGRGWGWATAWFNLAGLVTVLAAINVGTYEFCVHAFPSDYEPEMALKIIAVLGITFSQAAINQRGIRLTARLTDFSGYLILVVAAALTILLLAYAPTFEPARLITFANYGGLPEGDDPVLPAAPTAWLFLLGFVLPAYTVTGFDASAHAAEETVGAGVRVPRGIVGSVLTSGIAGWIMLCAIVLAMPDLDAGAREGENVVYWTFSKVFPEPIRPALCAGIAVAQYLCGLATVTSASRMLFAFARDGGVPFSAQVSHVHPERRTPGVAIWTAAVLAVLFTVYTPVYAVIATVAAIFLYISYVIPTFLGWLAHGTRWTQMGPWHVGRWYRPLAVVSMVGCAALIVIGLLPPYEKAGLVLAGMIVLLAAGWFAAARRHFPGPPSGLIDKHRQAMIEQAEEAVHQR